MKVAVIGTAGRGEGVDLDAALWAKLKEHFYGQLEVFGPGVELVSGGAPWADHLAVSAFVDGKVEKLTVYAPAQYIQGGYIADANVQFNPGKRLEELYDKFETANPDARAELRKALETEGVLHVHYGFFERNRRVAEAADYILAYSFGSDGKFTTFTTAEEAGIPKGGTAYTWNNSRAVVKHSVSLADLAAKDHTPVTDTDEEADPVVPVPAEPYNLPETFAAAPAEAPTPELVAVVTQDPAVDVAVPEANIAPVVEDAPVKPKRKFKAADPVVEVSANTETNTVTVDVTLNVASVVITTDVPAANTEPTA